MTYEPPEHLNLADHLLDARIREGRGGRVAVLTDEATHTYADIRRLADRYANLLAGSGAECEHRVMIALPDGADYVGALFGALKLGAVVVMANPALAEDEIDALLDYTRARIVVTHRDTAAILPAAARRSRWTRHASWPASAGWAHRLAALARSRERLPPTATIRRSGCSRVAPPGARRP